ncbi:MAG: LysR family transcriptional regulator [Cocleimonas sp.]|nr:LysR family transcriptional regulator [Cocleimonas sp.]
MDLKNYIAFLAVADHNSFSRAADTLYITQPAVSKRIALLEQHLGCALFDRIGRGVILNQAGKALYPIAQRIKQSFNESHQVINDLSGKVGGQLSLVTSHHIGLRRLPKPLKAFSQRYPRVQFDIAFMDSEVACREIEKGNYEVGIVTLPLKPSKRLKLTPLWDDSLVIAISPDHQLAHKKNITLEKLAHHNAILPAIGTYTRALIEEPIIQKQGALNIVLETNYLETIHMMVSIGLGWSALPRTMLSDKVIEIPVDELEIHRELGIVVHADRNLSNAAIAMISLLV